MCLYSLSAFTATGKEILQVRKIAEKMDATLKELMTGTLLFGLVCLAAGVWFVDSPLKYILGLLIGLVLALSAAWHMH